MAFELLNSDAVFLTQDVESSKVYLRILTIHYGLTKTDCYESNNITAISIINNVQAEIKNEDFVEEFDGVVVNLNDKVIEDAKKLVTTNKLRKTTFNLRNQCLLIPTSS